MESLKEGFLGSHFTTNYLTTMRADDVLCKEDSPVLSSEKRNETA